MSSLIDQIHEIAMRWVPHAQRPIGTYKALIDAKSRLYIPTPLVSSLKRDTSKELTFLFLDNKVPFLSIIPQKYWTNIERSLVENAFKREYADDILYILLWTQKGRPIDAQSRALIPDFARSELKPNSEVYCVSYVSQIHIFSEEAFHTLREERKNLSQGNKS